MRPKLFPLIILAGLISCQSQSDTSIQREQDFNFDWKFTLLSDTAKPGIIPMDDAAWRDIRLPHDWSIEASFDSTLEGCTGYLPGGVGVYQKHFTTPPDNANLSTYILFDGVYNNATFWINGNLLGENPYGYSPVYFDLSNHLKEGSGENILTVHVDHSRYADSRWYTGSGIYRNVKLISLHKLHIPIWGTYLTTPEISEKRADVHLETRVVNQLASEASIKLSTRIFDPANKPVASAESSHNLASGSAETFVQDLVVPDPLLWDCENPNMYRAVTTITHGGEEADRYETPFGIRKLVFEAGKGFFLNGERTFIKGVCLHHDGGLVGAAVPKGVWRRRLEELKAGGVNSIRTAHNPYSEEFMDLCDEMGFLVQDEFFDEFDYAKDKRQNYHDRHDDYITRGYDRHFRKWGKSDLTRTVLRDRNHPSVYQWSLGNEIEWTYLHYRYVTGFWTDPNDPQNPGGYWGSYPMFSPEEMKERYERSEKGEFILTETARKLNAWVKELDPSRVTTTNCVLPQVSHVSGYADAVDIIGYSYANPTIPWAYKHFPDRQITINEIGGSWEDWKQVLEYPGLFGMYMWTGISYLGESNGRWPSKDAGGDMLDLAGFKRQGWHFFKSIWVDEPHISLATRQIGSSGYHVDEQTGKLISNATRLRRRISSNTHWNYTPGEMILVEVCSNHSIVELFINGRSLGSKSMSDFPDRIFRWAVPFEEGSIKAKSTFDGSEISAELTTATQPVAITISPDKTSLEADAYDVAHLVVQLVDKEGRAVKTEEARIQFEIEGPARLLGVDNGARRNTQDFQSNSLVTSQGRCLAIIQSTKEPGIITVEVNADGMEGEVVRLNIQ